MFARLPEIVARAMTAPGWAAHLKGVDPKSVTSRAALAKLPLLRKSELHALQKANPPFGGFNVTPPGQGEAAAHVARSDLRAAGPRRGFRRRGARAVRRRLPRRRRGAQLVLLSSHARRLHSGGRRAHARLRHHPRRRRQHRAAARGDRASQADGLHRHARFPEDPARHRREVRQGRIVDQARAGVRRSAAGNAARGAARPRRRGAAVLRHRRDRRHRLRKRGERARRA